MAFSFTRIAFLLSDEDRLVGGLSAFLSAVVSADPSAMAPISAFESGLRPAKVTMVATNTNPSTEYRTVVFKVSKTEIPSLDSSAVFLLFSNFY